MVSIDFPYPPTPSPHKFGQLLIQVVSYSVRICGARGSTYFGGILHPFYQELLVGYNKLSQLLGARGTGFAGETIETIVLQKMCPGTRIRFLFLRLM